MIKSNDNLYMHIKDEIKEELVFDIGANQGLITEILLNFGAKVIAVEPQFEKLMSPKFSDVIAKVCACVSNKDGEVDFHQCLSHNTISTCFSDWKDG